jgi:hypothetical protein
MNYWGKDNSLGVSEEVSSSIDNIDSDLDGGP